MTWVISVPYNKCDALIGTADPNHHTPNFKARFLEHFLDVKFKNEHCAIRVEQKSSIWPSAPLYVHIYTGQFRTEKQIAQNIKSTLVTLPQIKSKLPLTRIFKSRAPADIYRIDERQIYNVASWLIENYEPQDYQFYIEGVNYQTKFFLTLQNPEHSTMFKLTFGE